MPLDIQVEQVPPTVNVYVRGEVDLYSSPDLRNALLKAVAQARDGVIVHLEGVVYMDSSGVATLVEGLKANADQSQSFVLKNPSQAVSKVLALSRLDRVFQIERDA